MTTKIILWQAFYWVTDEYVDADYSEYLGPDYREKMKPIKKVSTIVSNHVSFMDVIIMVASDLQPAFTPSIKFKNAPLLSSAANALQSIWVARGANPEEKEQIVQSIIER